MRLIYGDIFARDSAELDLLLFVGESVSEPWRIAEQAL